MATKFDWDLSCLIAVEVETEGEYIRLTIGRITYLFTAEEIVLFTNMLTQAVEHIQRSDNDNLRA
jgi:hypothetical protein